MVGSFVMFHIEEWFYLSVMSQVDTHIVLLFCLSLQGLDPTQLPLFDLLKCSSASKQSARGRLSARTLLLEALPIA